MEKRDPKDVHDELVRMGSIQGGSFAPLMTEAAALIASLLRNQATLRRKLAKQELLVADYYEALQSAQALETELRSQLDALHGGTEVSGFMGAVLNDIELAKKEVTF